MAFIKTVPPAEAEGPVREMYERTQAQMGFLPNWARAFSARPGVLEGWMTLLKSIRSNLSVRAYELSTLAAARASRQKRLRAVSSRASDDMVFRATARPSLSSRAA